MASEMRCRRVQKGGSIDSRSQNHVGRPEMKQSREDHMATFVLSAGRCGTQWLATALARHASGSIEVQHEPLYHQYAPRLLLGRGASLGEHPYASELDSHVNEVLGTLRSRHYVETGWPAFAAIPWLHSRLGSRMRVIHLTRSPIESACSMVTHRYYQPALRADGYTRFAILQPTDAGVRNTDYVERWPHLSVYEKCLFLWGEIHGFGLALREMFPEPGTWLTVSMENLFDSTTGVLEEVIDFLELPDLGGVNSDVGRVVDVYRMTTDIHIEWREIWNHPSIVSLAALLGYEPLAASSNAIRARYCAL